MKSPIFLALVFGFAGAVLLAAAEARDTVTLTRDPAIDTNAAVRAPGRLAVSNAQPADRPAGERGKLKLPPTIINIEDRSEMLLDRDSTLRLLLPEIERAKLRLDEPGHDSVRDGSVAGRNRRGRDRDHGPGGTDGSIRGNDPGRGRQILSAFEVSYGFHDALEALVTTGMESGDMSYQLSYARQRDEGFDRDGDRLANSQRGRDSLVFDFSYNHDAFDIAAGLSFRGEMAGLQANTNFSQSRTSALALDVRCGYILSSVSRLRFDLLVGQGNHVLDNPLARSAHENYTADAVMTLAMQWPDRLSLTSDAGIIFEESADEDSTATTSSVTAFSGGTKLGFALGSFTFTVGARLLAATEVRFAPSVDVNWRLSEHFSFFADAGREVYWLRFRNAIVGSPFQTASLPSLPVDRARFAFGTRWQPLEIVSVVGTLAQYSYTRYYGLESAGNGLWQYAARSLDMTVFSAELRLAPANWFVIRAGWVQRMLSDDVPLLAGTEFKAGMELILAATGTTLSADVTFEDGRDCVGLDSYVLANIGLRQKLGETTAIVAGVRNLFGSDYRIRPEYAEAGMTLHAGFSVRF